MQYTFTIHRNEDILQHHGILGMKWGVRRFQNSDGTLTDAGKKRYADSYSEAYANTKKNKYSTSPEDIAAENNKELSNKLKEIHKDLSEDIDKLNQINDEADEIMSGYFKPYTRHDGSTGQMPDPKYTALAGINSPYIDDDPTMSELAGNIWFYTCEDGDQGYGNSVSCYLAETKQYDKASENVSKYMKQEDAYNEHCKTMVNELLGEYGDTKIKGSSYKIVGQQIVDGFDNSDTAKHISESYMRELVYSGTEPSISQTSKDTLSKINLGNDANKAFNNINRNIVDAVEETGLADKRVSEMTDDDWKKFNDRLNG